MTYTDASLSHHVAGGVHTVLDYWITERNVESTTTVVNDQGHFLRPRADGDDSVAYFDHFPVVLVLHGERHFLRGISHCKSHTGWQVQDRDDLRLYQQRIGPAVENNVVKHRNWDASGALDAVNGEIYHTATNMNASTANTRKRDALRKPEDLLTMEQQERLETDPNIRRGMRKTLRKKQRAHRNKVAKATVLGSGPRKAPPRITALLIGDEEDRRPLYDHTDWAPVIQNFCEEKYHRPEITVDHQRREVELLMGQATAAEATLGAHKVGNYFTLSVTMRARSCLKRGSASGPDGCVAEMFLALPLDSVYHIHALFYRRVHFGGALVPCWKKL